MGVVIKYFCAISFLLACPQFTTIVSTTIFELWFFSLVEVEMAQDKRIEDSTLAGFYEAMEKSNIEKITDEILAGCLKI
jgi:hypothetical protein